MGVLRNLIILGIFLNLSSCSPSRFCERRFPPKTDTIIQRDTIWKERIIEIKIPKDSSELFVPKIDIQRWPNNKPIIKFKKSKQASVKLTIDSTGIKAQAICSEKDSIIKVLEAEIREKQNISSIQHIPVKKVPWYLKWAGYWSLVSIPLTIVWIGNKLRKLFTIF